VSVQRGWARRLPEAINFWPAQRDSQRRLSLREQFTVFPMNSKQKSSNDLRRQTNASFGLQT
jgi:hypothetical protein